MTFRPDSKKECLLSEDLVALMRENFERLDKHEDLVVPRAALVDSIRKDVRVKKYLNVGVIYLPKVRKEIALRKVLHQIEQEEFIKADQLDAGDSNFVSSKKYISWKNFMDYFINYNQNQNVTDADLEFKKDETDDQSLIEIPKTLKEKMRAIFNELKDEDGFVKSFDFLNKLKSDPTVINMLEAQSRIRAKYGDIPPEKLRETLARIEDTIEDYTDWDEFMQYFTRRGVPLEVEKQSLQVSNLIAPLVPPPVDRESILKKANIAQGSAQLFPVAASVDKTGKVVPGPQMPPENNFERFNSSYMPPGKGPQGKLDHQYASAAPPIDRTQMIIPHVRMTADPLAETQTKFEVHLQAPPNTLGDHQFPSGEREGQPLEFLPAVTTTDRMFAEDEDDPYVIDDFVYFGDDAKRHKITIPDPLKFEAREKRRSDSTKNRKFKEYLEQKRLEEEEALRFRFRAKSVPKQVKEPLFDKIMQVAPSDPGPRAPKRRSQEELYRADPREREPLHFLRARQKQAQERQGGLQLPPPRVQGERSALVLLDRALQPRAGA